MEIYLVWRQPLRTSSVISSFDSEDANLKEGDFSSVQFSHTVMSDYLWIHGLQHARLPCPSPTPKACSNLCPSSRWCHPTTSSSIVPFSSCLQSGSFPMSQIFASGSQSIEVSASASVLPMNIQDWFPLGLTGLISLQSKGPSRVFSNTTVQKHQIVTKRGPLEKGMANHFVFLPWEPHEQYEKASLLLPCKLSSSVQFFLMVHTYINVWCLFSWLHTVWQILGSCTSLQTMYNVVLFMAEL